MRGVRCALELFLVELLKLGSQADSCASKDRERGGVLSLFADRVIPAAGARALSNDDEANWLKAQVVLGRICDGS